MGDPLRILRAVASVIAAVVLLASCTNGPDPTDLRGEWSLAEISVNGVQRLLHEAEADVRITVFDDGTSITDGCINAWFAEPYEPGDEIGRPVDGSSFFGEDCNPPTDSFNRLFGGELASSTERDGRLVVTFPSRIGEVIASFDRSAGPRPTTPTTMPDRAMFDLSGEWRLDSIEDTPGGLWLPEPTSPVVRLTIGESGSTLVDGCEAFSDSRPYEAGDRPFSGPSAGFS